MTSTTISPFVVGSIEEVELSDGKGGKQKLWRKEILPSGTRQYKGQTLDFAQINASCIKAFEDGATDSVPFVLALPDNKHPSRGQELETMEGDLTKLEMSAEGSLFGYFDLSNSAKVQGLIAKSNGKLGVSGAIEVDYKREDTGKQWPYALSHVCGTTGPHIKGMKPWESVELTEEEKKGITLDLSTEVIEEVRTDDKKEGDQLVAVEIPQASLDKLLVFLSEMEKADEMAKKLNSGGDGGDTKTAELSEEATKRIEFAETQAAGAMAFAEATMAKAAVRDWEVTKRELAAAGVPPVMLTEAEPIMKLHKHASIQLSDTETLDASDVIAKLLDHAKGTIKLNEESGHGFGDNNGSGSLDDDPEYKAFMSSFVLPDPK